MYKVNGTEFRPERATYNILHNSFSSMEFPNFLKYLLLDFQIQSTLLFIGTFPFDYRKETSEQL